MIISGVISLQILREWRHSCVAKATVGSEIGDVVTSKVWSLRDRLKTLVAIFKYNVISKN